MTDDRDRQTARATSWHALVAKWEAQAVTDRAAGDDDLADLEERTARLLAQAIQVAPQTTARRRS